MTVRIWLVLAALGAVLAATILLSVPASAAPDQQVVNYAVYNAGRICATLDAYPTLPGVDGVLDGIQSDSGFGDYQTGQVIALAVNGFCPRHLALLRRYAYTIAGPATGVVA